MFRGVHADRPVEGDAAVGNDQGAVGLQRILQVNRLGVGVGAALGVHLDRGDLVLEFADLDPGLGLDDLQLVGEVVGADLGEFGIAHHLGALGFHLRDLVLLGDLAFHGGQGQALGEEFLLHLELGHLGAKGVGVGLEAGFGEIVVDGELIRLILGRIFLGGLFGGGRGGDWRADGWFFGDEGGRHAKQDEGGTGGGFH